MTAEMVPTGALGGLSPGLILIIGALAVPFLKEQARGPYLLLLPVLAFFQLMSLDHGLMGVVSVFDIELVTLRVDRLSFIFGTIFLIATLLSMIYQYHVKGWMEHTAGMIYAGSAVGAVFSGDLVSLFLFWEGTAIASVFLIWATRTPEAMAAGQRYLIVQVGSGVLLLAGTMVHYGQTGSLAFDSFDVETTAGLLIFLSFGIKCAFPLMHNWLQDAYPQATVTGTVMLSAFTTKLAVYALARGFAGTEILVPIGAVMTAFPIFYAVIENDLRRVLAYSLNNQLGFMVVGIGIGTELAVSGAAAHAFCHILYKALLFMSMGAVLLRTGTVKGSELGGLYRTMPWTATFCAIGAASISAFPLFSGFVSKSLIISAAMKEGYFVTWLVLLFASAGVFHHSGIKIPFFAFFAHDSGMRPKEAPTNMLIAMAIAATLCIGIGVFPGPLYAILPYDVSYHAYSLEHVITQLQLLIFSALAFTVLMRTGLYPPELRSTNLDSDWIWRKGGGWVLGRLEAAWRGASAALQQGAIRGVQRFVANLYKAHGPESALARTRPSGYMALWMTLLLGVFMLFAFI
ncbi:Na(+)/H(+) antiporter subunit D [Paralimibaculum aggregatum]|uniref:Na(+)/H(+) antiporter subunit D n=1 Tax=Paralimibaculum aggregatum TaxID=3036245 RepID=A0ABQ6LMA1_9RHOB|nr:Na(+)/H(+) antiporter subunit D [Limibaculum sp. NKW23]GMG84334.1 Na(+)/H(+) antiporter subunit D [Limibaculum sp. NKW23]